MQEAVLAAVERFSRFVGLRLNVHKSVAIRLGREIAESGEENSTCGSSVKDIIPTSEESRYLGHLAGEGDTVTNAWERAFKALSVRLALARRKTNTVQQRAQLAAAIIIPKLLYVGRHACPTLAIVAEAGRRIKNFIWKSKFTIAEQVVVGWIPAEAAEMAVQEGGLAIPNITAELIAMEAHAVGDWAMMEHPVLQTAGELLQEATKQNRGPLVPIRQTVAAKVRDSLWATGRPWVESSWVEPEREVPEGGNSDEDLRALLRHSNGLVTRWNSNGLRCSFEGLANSEFMKTKRQREVESGAFSYEAFLRLPAATIKPRNASGEQRPWK
ncbi:hypothetical protein JG688_00015711 [Phytophthora aleatoria]|uniref:Reverse transcriptase domain-containing protein n=1 Tax=Phytophthora aleatoria TaxID=2496075 RepID=A0A8J5IZ48_9STRA|nr:hypothetical protein JG688_00015711 [Phytophthora aleatoria]